MGMAVEAGPRRRQRWWCRGTTVAVSGRSGGVGRWASEGEGRGGRAGTAAVRGGRGGRAGATSVRGGHGEGRADDTVRGGRTTRAR
jgi:hypothetical protein